MLRLILCLGLLLLLGTTTHGGEDPKDPKNWKPIEILGNQKAPEFEEVTEWVQSEPLRMKDLKGKVVVVHFMAFG
jgi:hypothetical protein